MESAIVKRGVRHVVSACWAPLRVGDVVVDAEVLLEAMLRVCNRFSLHFDGLVVLEVSIESRGKTFAEY